MKNKIKIITLFLLLSSICAMAFIGFMVSRFNNYFIAVPKINGNGISLTAIEEINENKVLVTYENLYDKTVKALKSNFNVVLKGTNYTYPYVMNYNFITGGFFTKEEYDNKNNVVVLNEKAAFDIYGTLNTVGNELQIDLTSYIIIGIIDDNDEDNLNIFVPATCFSQTAEALLINLSKDSTEEYIKNELKYIGVVEQRYDFLNLGLIIKTIKDKMFISFEIVVFGLFLIFIKILMGFALYKLREVNRQREDFYFKEILRVKSKPLQKLIFSVIAVVGMMISEFIIFLNVFEKLLILNSVKRMFDNVNYISFTMNISQVKELYLLSNVLFLGFGLLFIIFMVIIWD